MEILDPTKIPNWDQILLNTPGYSFFHSSAWARVLKEAYGYLPRYFAEIQNGRFSILVPVMEINSFLTGKRGVSLPFTDYCEPICEVANQFEGIWGQIQEKGRTWGWKSIEIRGGQSFFSASPSSSIYLGHVLKLAAQGDAIKKGFRDSTKRNIKKAGGEGVTVETSNSLQSLMNFVKLNQITRRAHGIPPQPIYFFEKVHEHILSKGHGLIVSASYQGQEIAAAVFFYFGEKVIYKYGASDRRYQHLRGNNLVMWEAIKSSCERGYKHFCFGRTEPENSGLLQFKSGWGAEENNIAYFRYNFKSMAMDSNNESGSKYYNRLFNRMPLPMLNALGSFFYKHIG